MLTQSLNIGKQKRKDCNFRMRTISQLCTFLRNCLVLKIFSVHFYYFTVFKYRNLEITGTLG